METRIAATVAALALLATGCVSVGAVEGQVELPEGYRDDRTQVQMVTTLIGGKNVFIPSTVIVSEGTGRSLSIYNTTDTPHGFRIPDLGVEVVLMPGEETVVELPALAGGRIHEMVCHLHPPHRTGTLMVVHRE